MKKKILFLGDGVYTKNLINYYDKNSFDRYLIDLKIDKSTKKKFFKTYQVNLLDKKKIFSIAKKIGIDFVITNQNDFAMPTYGYLCSKLKLNGIPEYICNRFSDKKICRNYLKKINNCRKFIPNFYFSINEIPKNNIDKKLILKPSKMQGSRYVEKINYNQLEKKIDNLKKRKINYIIEEYVEGEDYAVESAVINGVVKSLVLSKKSKFFNTFIDQKIISKNYTSNILEKEILKVNKIIIKNLKLKNGLTHLEFRCNKKKKIFLIEAACRGAGSGISNIIVPYLTNFDSDNFLFKMSLGQKLTIKSLNDEKRRTKLHWLKKNEKVNFTKKKDILFYKRKKISFKILNSEDRGSYYIKKF